MTVTEVEISAEDWERYFADQTSRDSSLAAERAAQLLERLSRR